MPSKKKTTPWDEPDGRSHDCDAVDDWFDRDSVKAYRQAWARVRPRAPSDTKNRGGSQT